MKPLSTMAIAAATVAILTTPVIGAERVYVPLGSDNAIIVIDPVIDAIVNRIDGIPAVHGLAATPDGRFLVAGSFDEREPGTMATEKPAGMAEDEHAAHHAVDTTRGDVSISTVSIINVATGSVVRRVDVPGAVHHVVVDPTGRYAALTHPSQDAVTILDLADYEVAATVPTGPLPNYAVFSPDGRHLYVSNAGNGTVSDVTADGWTVGRNLVVGESPEHIVLSPDGETLYVNNVDDGTVSLVDTAAGSVTRTFEAGELLHGIDLSDDGETIFVADRTGGYLAAIDAQSGIREATALSPSPYHLAAVRGLGKLYVSSAEEPKIWIIDQKTRTVVGEIEIGGRGHQMVQVSG